MMGPLGTAQGFARRTLSASGAVLGTLGGAAIGAALRSSLIDVAARDIARYGVLERIARPLAASRALDEVIAALGDTGVPRRVADQLLQAGVVEQVMDSGVVDEALARLLESPELWMLVEEVARSPAVTEAISQQSIGLAEQVAGVVRARSGSADARLERLAHRVARRRPPATRVGDRPARAGPD